MPRRRMPSVWYVALTLGVALAERGLFLPHALPPGFNAATAARAAPPLIAQPWLPRSAMHPRGPDRRGPERGAPWFAVPVACAAAALGLLAGRRAGPLRSDAAGRPGIALPGAALAERYLRPSGGGR